MGLHAVRLASNGGKTAAPGAVSATPVAATGQTLADAATGADHTATVVGGKAYAVTANATGTMLMGILTTATAANIIWVCPPSQTIIIDMPEGENTLHYQGDTNATTVYLREVMRNPLNQ